MIPNFSIPSEDCFLSVDKNGTILKVGDRIISNLIPLRGDTKKLEIFNPIEEYDGKLIIKHAGSHLLSYFVKAHCEIYH